MRAPSPDIRPSRPHDAVSILAVVLDAFDGAEHDGAEEVDIVRRTWAAAQPEDLLEFVADDGGTVVGHVLAAPGRLDGRAVPVGGVAPLCVAPAHQGRGVGTALVQALMAAAEERGWALLVLLGDPAYYARFGFVPSARLGLVYAPVGAGDPHFQARPLRGFGEATLAGTFSYVWE